VRVNLHEPLFTVPQFTGKSTGRATVPATRVRQYCGLVIALANGLPKPVSPKLCAIVVGSTGTMERLASTLGSTFAVTVLLDHANKEFFPMFGLL
jgi:hypothetical protein